MTVRKVIKMGNPLLREVAKEFTKDEILSGDLLQVVEPLGTEHQADLLAAMASE